MSSTFFFTVSGVMPFSWLYCTCLARLLSVSAMARSIDPVIRSAYMMTFPFSFLAALPIVWIRDVSERRKPSLSASKIATKPHSGISKPSLKRLMPTRTSKAPNLKSRSISIRSIVSISECIYRTLTPCSFKYSVRSSAILFVRVVTRVRKPLWATLFTSSKRSSTCISTGRISTSGSRRPVGLITCSVNTPPVCSNSHPPGVAET